MADNAKDAIQQVQKTVRKNPRKDIRELQKIKKNLRITISNITDACEKIILKERLKFLKEHIKHKIKENRGNRIKRIVESINNKIDNDRKIWEVKWNVKKKHETPHFIINNEGTKIKTTKKY